MLGTPLLGQVMAHFALVRFARMLGTLVGAGVSLVTSLRTAREAIGNQTLADTVSYAIEQVQRGTALSASLANSPKLFPPSVVEMVAVAEETGRLDKELMRIATTYEADLDRQLRLLVAVGEPIMLFLMAGIIGTVVVGMLLPILNLQDVVNRVGVGRGWSVASGAPPTRPTPDNHHNRLPTEEPMNDPTKREPVTRDRLHADRAAAGDGDPGHPGRRGGAQLHRAGRAGPESAAKADIATHEDLAQRLRDRQRPLPHDRGGAGRPGDQAERRPAQLARRTWTRCPRTRGATTTSTAARATTARTSTCSAAGPDGREGGSDDITADD